MSLTRTAFLLLAVVYLMPTPPEPVAPRNDLSADAAAPQIVDAATSAFSDVSEFCGRQPTVCLTAGHLAHKLEAKAKYSVRLLYEWANDGNLEHPAAAAPLENEAEADPLTTSSTLSRVAGEAEVSTGTLTIEDLIPEWRGPKKVRNG
ncbi:MAG: DUF5330 domain-containing protein [Parvibaculaceae bacterium]